MWLTVNAPYRVAGDEELLVGWDDVRMQGGVLAAYLSLSPYHALILLFVQLQTCPFQSFANPTPDVGRVFSDPSCKDHRVRATHGYKKCSDILSRAIAKQVDRKAYPTVFVLL